MNFKHKKLIIFDFDGTLINSIPELTSALNKMLTHFGLKTLTEKEANPFIGNGAKTLVQRALNHSADQPELANKLFDEAFDYFFSSYQNNSCEKTYLYKGVSETLNYLKDKGYKMAICTNKPYDFIEPILDKLDIKHFFQIWIGENSLAQKKPEAAPLLHLAEKMNATIGESIMIGDSKNDILAAQNAKMDSIGVSYGYNYNENIDQYKPSVVVDSFTELQKLF